MSDRTETLLFIVDVMVKNANALRALDDQLDRSVGNQQRRLLALQDAIGKTADEHDRLVESMRQVDCPDWAHGPCGRAGPSWCSWCARGRVSTVCEAAAGGLPRKSDCAFPGVRDLKASPSSSRMPPFPTEAAALPKTVACRSMRYSVDGGCPRAGGCRQCTRDYQSPEPAWRGQPMVLAAI